MYIIDQGFADSNSITYCKKVDGILYGATAEVLDGVIEINRVRIDKISAGYKILDFKEKSKYIMARFKAVLTIILLAFLAWSIPYQNVNCCVIVMAAILGIDIFVYKCSILKYLEHFWFQLGNSSSNRKHCAEHKVINAYEKLKRIPTFEEAKKFSGFTVECGNVKNIGCIQALIVFFLMGIILNAVGVTEDNVIMIYFLSCGIYAMIYSHDWFKYLAWFSLEKPKDSEIRMAILAMEEYEKFQQELVEDKEKALRELNGVIHLIE